MAGEAISTPLGELCDPNRGITYGIVKVGKFVPGGVRVIRGGDIRNGRIAFDDEKRVSSEVSRQYQRTILKGGEIVINLIAEPGHTAVVPSDFAGANVSRDVGVIPLQDTVDHRYVNYCLKSPMAVRWLTSRLQGSVTQKINLATLRELPVPTPSLEEQRAIAHILGTLDDKIELNQRMNETLEAMARALFKSWFVDFDPVRAKAEGRDPSLPPDVAALFPDRLVESELGEIPEGWEVGKLGDVATHPRRGVKPNEIGADTAYIALEHMPKQCIALSEWGTADGLESNKFYFKKGEFLFGKLRPYFHKVGVAPTDGVCSTDIVVVTPLSMSWYGFVLGHISSVAFVEYTNVGSTGTKMPRTSWHDMARYAVALPPEPIAAAFARMVQPSVERIVAGIHESRTLTALRDTLLPKLISGELRVKDAERIVREATA